jgi:hypothetical protein
MAWDRTEQSAVPLTVGFAGGSPVTAVDVVVLGLTFAARDAVFALSAAVTRALVLPAVSVAAGLAARDPPHPAKAH